MAPSTTLAATVSRRPVVAGVGAAAIVLSVWAAAAPRPVRAILVPGRTGPDTSPPALDQQLGQGEIADPPITGPWAGAVDAASTLFVWGSVLALVLVCLVVAVIVLRWVLAAWRDRLADPAPDPSAAPSLESVALAVAGDSEQRLGALAAGSPAEGIIRAWSRLEETLGGAGVPLVPSRTSTEVTLDVLHRFDVDRGALRALAGLYREARYSRHELTEDDRARAEAAYRALDADLGSAALRTEGARRG